MDISNEEIAEFIAKNCSLLETILKIERSEYQNAPKESPCKNVESIEEAEEIFKKAKSSIDELLHLGPNAYNLSVEFKKYGTDRVVMSSYISNGILLVGGAILATTGGSGIMMGGFMSGIGLLRLINLHSISSNGKNPGFSKEQNKIYISKKGKDDLLQDMTQAYALAVAENNFNETSLNYGFAAGASGCVLRQGESRRNELKQSANLLKYAIRAIKKGNNKYVKSLKDKLNKAGLIHTAQKEAMALGYSAFRLAEEKRGSGIYREILEGDYSPLIG
ncbi:MAG: hypothetical protein V1734_06200 [Nanoarchaeota archaeon]